MIAKYKIAFKILVLPVGILILTYVTLSLSSCGNYFNDECENVIQAPQEFLDYWFFTEGSWWLYRNQHGELDTVTCISRDSSFYTPDEAYGLIPCLYYYKCIYEHSNKTYFPLGMSNRHNIEGLSSSGVSWNLLASNSNNYYYLKYFFKYPFNVGDTIDYLKSGNDEYLSTIEATDSFSINKEIIFDIVRIFHFNSKISANDYMKYIWIGKKIGIIKIQYSFDYYWELIDYDINK